MAQAKKKVKARVSPLKKKNVILTQLVEDLQAQLAEAQEKATKVDNLASYLLEFLDIPTRNQISDMVEEAVDQKMDGDLDDKVNDAVQSALDNASISF